MLSTSRMTPPSHFTPLAPLSTNLQFNGPRHDIFMSHTPAHTQGQENQYPSSTTTIPQPFSKRPVKKAPSPKPEELKSKRRNRYLQNVRDRRDQRRFETRGDDMMRTEFLRRQKEWEERLASSAPEFYLNEDEEEEEGVEEGVEGWRDLPISRGTVMGMDVQGSQMMPTIEEEVEKVVRREKEELEALLAYLSDHGGGRAEENPWSDDEEYDAVFSELMAQQQQKTQGGESGDEMDLS